MGDVGCGMWDVGLEDVEDWELKGEGVQKNFTPINIICARSHVEHVYFVPRNKDQMMIQR